MKQYLCQWSNVFVAVLCLGVTSLGAHAANQTFLIADEVTLDANGDVIAIGNVEIFIDKSTLRAQRIIWNQENDTVYAPEEFTLVQENGSIFKGTDGRVDRILGTHTASEIRGLLNGRLHIAAQALRRTSALDNREISSFYRARLSSCKICNNNRPPFWELRGASIVHEDKERQYYLRNATLRVLGVPVIYTPYIRIPDPSVERYTGFLTPKIRSSQKIKSGVLLPYFIALSPHKDLLITPHIALNSRGLNLRYRQAFQRGFLTVEGRVSQDDIIEEMRHALTIHGTYTFKNNIALTYHYENASDDTYQNDYGYDSGLRRDRYLALSRTRRQDHFDARLTAYTPLRNGTDDRYENNIFSGHYDRVWNDVPLGDQIRLSAYGRQFSRNSSQDQVGADPRMYQARLEWNDLQILKGGFELSSAFGASAQNYSIKQDSRFKDPQSALAGFAAVSLRYPLKIQTSSSTWHITPSIGVAHETGTLIKDTPLSDTIAEFDTGTLLGNSDLFHSGERFTGTKLAFGATIERQAEQSSFRFSLGKIISKNDAQGRTEQQSNNSYLQIQYDHSGGFTFLGHSTLNPQGKALRTQWKVALQRSNWSLALGYNHLKASEAFNQNENIEDWRANGTWTVNPQLKTNASLGYDLRSSDFTTAGFGVNYDIIPSQLNLTANVDLEKTSKWERKETLGLRYVTECVAFELKSTQSFKEDDELEPPRVIEWKIELLSSISNQSAYRSRTCR